MVAGKSTSLSRCRRIKCEQKSEESGETLRFPHFQKFSQTKAPLVQVLK